jgi:dsDNA-binding SOS-regulon protein
MTNKVSVAMRKKERKRGKLSLYPLKFKDVLADVLKVKPEPKSKKMKATPKSKTAAKRD